MAVQQTRNRYGEEFKRHALARAEKEGVAVAAKDLDVQESQIYGCCAKSGKAGQMTDEQRTILTDHARLKRKMARLEEENSFF